MGGNIPLKSETGQWPTPLQKKKKEEEEEEVVQVVAVAAAAAAAAAVVVFKLYLQLISIYTLEHWNIGLGVPPVGMQRKLKAYFMNTNMGHSGQ
jgi:hypothetical protein